MTPITPNWQDRLNELWNDHDGTHFYKDEFKDLIRQEKALSEREGYDRGVAEQIRK